VTGAPYGRHWKWQRDKPVSLEGVVASLAPRVPWSSRMVLGEPPLSLGERLPSGLMPIRKWFASEPDPAGAMPTPGRRRTYV